jgi:hypothetical protein
VVELASCREIKADPSRQNTALVMTALKVAKEDGGKPQVSRPTASGHLSYRAEGPDRQTVKELPQPQVLLTLGLLNLNPAPSSVSM